MVRQKLQLDGYKYSSYNLGEIVDASFNKDKEISETKLFNIISGPDFPTGGS